MNEKIQKVLARAGIGSRRQIESWIQIGRITINGRPAIIGSRMNHYDKVSIDGREIKQTKSHNQKTRILLYYKPEGEICTRRDPEGRSTIFDNLPTIRNSRWITIGRLDLTTSGLLLITNNGELGNKLMHPSSRIEREYAVRLRGKATRDILNRLQKGVHLKDGFAHFDRITDAENSGGSNHWYHVIVKEGRNRLVRRLWESQNLTVSRLIRIRFGCIHLSKSLHRGRYIELTENKINELITLTTSPNQK
jgi:23S rRNA pseudouridine2605 synthase